MPSHTSKICIDRQALDPVERSPVFQTTHTLKAAKPETKMYELCESSSSCNQSFLIYTGIIFLVVATLYGWTDFIIHQCWLSSLSINKQTNK
jgi:hypothetical protein